MNTSGTGLVILAALLAIVVLRQAVFVADRRRIRRYLAECGGRLDEARWSPPHGPFWGEHWMRTYAVRYSDINGRGHDACFKTSWWVGVQPVTDTLVGASGG